MCWSDEVNKMWRSFLFSCCCSDDEEGSEKHCWIPRKLRKTGRNESLHATQKDAAKEIILCDENDKISQLGHVVTLILIVNNFVTSWMIWSRNGLILRVCIRDSRNYVKIIASDCLIMSWLGTTKFLLFPMPSTATIAGSVHGVNWA